MALRESMRRSTPSRIPPVLLVLVFSALPVEAAEPPAGPAAFHGVWVHAGEAEDGEARLKAIDALTEEVPKLFRAKARKGLREKTTPPRELKLELEGDLITLTGKGESVTLRLGGPPVAVERGERKGKLAARFDGERIVVEGAGKKGTRVTTYALSTDGTRLRVSVRMVPKRLSEPLVYGTTYRRQGTAPGR